MLPKLLKINAQFSSVFTEEDTSNIPTQEDLHIESPLTDLTITTEMVKKKLGLTKAVVQMEYTHLY